METKRCPRCNKLLRLDAPSCTRCGAVVSSGKTTRKAPASTSDSDVLLSQPTNPPASPHRAGHYSGLHPEDQPFQSSFFLQIKRPLTPVEPASYADPSLEQEMNASIPGAMLWEEDIDEFEDEDEIEDNFVHIQPTAGTFEAHARELADLPTLYPQSGPVTPLPATRQPLKPARPARRQGRVIPLLITAALLFFLLASGLLAFLFLFKNPASSSQPQLLATPGEVRVGDTLQLSASGFAVRHVVALLRDGQSALLDGQGQQIIPTTDAQGAFQVSIPITSAWKIGLHKLQATQGSANALTSLTVQSALSGPSHLQLDLSHIDLGADAPGTLSQKKITLTNAGGGKVNWQAKSDEDWLALNPSSGTFAGSAVVALTVNRANLVPQTYTGHVTFTQDQGSSQTLTVSMTVNNTPANMLLSTASLAFTGTPAQSPAAQTIVIQNAGGQALNWTAASITDWLSITPATGLLAPNTSAILTVTSNSSKMDVGIYQGSLNFSYAGGETQQVVVTLTVNPPPEPQIQVTPQALNFATNQGFNPAAQTFTIANPGDAPLNWQVQKDTNGSLYLGVTPQSGTIAVGQSATVTVTPVPGYANGTILSTLTILDSDQGTPVASQPLKVTLTITNQPILVLLTGNIEFDHTSSNTDTSAVAIFSNAGSLPLHWSLVESSQVSWLTFNNTSGTLATNDFFFLNLRCTSTQMKAGTYTLKLTLKDTDPGSIVAPQTFTVTLIIT